eukprot:NODE_22589_length_702_cov_2.926957.p5 GENE.NODE_22589_length_702_cov_2.926957~~NODE_22589_length_702_cov_2.926957.p5  ORF type:complete len:58 (+),score=24.57 NODE_22589_length_702_cov_2.926957:477-650(+)
MPHVPRVRLPLWAQFRPLSKDQWPRMKDTCHGSAPKHGKVKKKKKKKKKKNTEKTKP